MAEVGRDFWKKLGGEIARGKSPSGAKKPQKVVAESPEDDETTPDAAGGEGGEPAPEPEAKKKAAEPVAAAEGATAKATKRPRRKRRKRRRRTMEGGDAVEEPPRRGHPAEFDLQLGGAINRSLAYNETTACPGPAAVFAAGRARRWSPTSSGSRSARSPTAREEFRCRRPHRAGVFHLVDLPDQTRAVPERRQVQHRRSRVLGRRSLPDALRRRQLLLRLADRR